VSSAEIRRKGVVRQLVRYWPGIGNRQNFGDYLTEFLLEELFLPVTVRCEGVHLIGSVIDDMFFPPRREGVDALDDRLVFWGCGMRSENGLGAENQARSEIFAVRGPLSRSALRLGDAVPVGDSAFLVPALHEHRPDPVTTGRTICVPHILDPRSDDEILALTGCDDVLRAALPPSRQALHTFIDQVASAEFVLAGAMHAAVIAAGYGRPFAFWNNGHLDLPFKWADLAASLSIGDVFAPDLASGRAVHAERIRPALRLPPLWPLLASAPLAIRPEAAMRVLQHEWRGQPAADDLSRRLSQWTDLQRRTGELSGHEVGDAPQRWSARRIEALFRNVETLATASRELESRLKQRTDELTTAQGALEARSTELRRAQETATARAAELSENAGRIEGLEQLLRAKEKTVASLDAEVDTLRVRLGSAEAEVGRLAAVETELREISRKLERSHPILAAWKLAGKLRRRSTPVIRRSLAGVPGARAAVKVGRRVVRLGTSLVPSLGAERRLLAGSPLFDAAWYRDTHAEGLAGSDPFADYLGGGAAEGRDPSPFFATRWYLQTNPDVARSGMNPLVHYLRFGQHEGRRPNPDFDPRWYLTTYPDVARSGLEPFAHYFRYGRAEGRRPSAAGASGQMPAVGTGEGGGLMAPAPLRPLPRGVRNAVGPRVLFIDSVYPRPDRDSGSVTARFLIDLFLDLGWQVSFHADAEAHESSRYADALTAAGVRCLPNSEIGDLEAFLATEGHGFSLAMLFRVYSGGRHYETVRRDCPGAKIVFETVDLHFLREERQARLSGDRRALNDAYAMRERELYVARSADLAIVVSDFEHDLLRREIPGAEVMTLPLILDCPGRRQPFSAREGLCFVGGYLHRPNIDAVEYFLADIWPRVLTRLPTARFSVVGADMPASFARFASSSVRLVGYVKDIDEFLSTVRLTVAPLRYGAGVKGKIGSSLANGVPCVATPLAVEGMKLVPGEIVAVAEAPDDFAAQIVSLLQDEVAWTRMSDAAARFAVENYSLQAARARIEGMLKRLGLPAAGDTLRQPGGRKGDSGRSRDGSA